MEMVHTLNKIDYIRRPRMKVNICDICHHEKGIKKISRWRISFRNRTKGMTIALDACNEHKDWMKKFNTFEEAQKAVDELYMKPTPKLEGEITG
jgi:hypothetical protein